MKSIHTLLYLLFLPISLSAGSYSVRDFDFSDERNLALLEVIDAKHQYRVLQSDKEWEDLKGKPAPKEAVSIDANVVEAYIERSLVASHVDTKYLGVDDALFKKINDLEVEKRKLTFYLALKKAGIKEPEKEGFGLFIFKVGSAQLRVNDCLLYTSPSPRDA